MAGPIQAWLEERPRWLQTAFALRVTKGELSERDYDLLTELCIREASGTAKAGEFKAVTEGILDSPVDVDPLRLLRIESLRGINALNPASPLDFAGPSLSIVYGPTGTGKTGYTRLLRHACGSRFAGDLHQDVFSAKDETQSAVLVAQVSGKEVSFEWREPDGPIPTLTRIHIFDSDRAFRYLDRANEPAYEPFALQLFSAVIADCARVERRLGAKRFEHPSKLPALPVEYASTACGTWYRGLTRTTTADSVAQYCALSAEEAAELKSLDTALGAASPNDIIADRNRKLGNCRDLLEDLETLEHGLATSVGQHVRKLRQTAKSKRAIATNKAKALFAASPLTGIGEDEWREMWEAARVYSEQIAYPTSTFPVTKKGAVCVLCQQRLIDGAKRLKEFEQFVSDALGEAAQVAEEMLDDEIARIPELITLKEIGARFDALASKFDYKALHKALAVRRKWILADDTAAAPPLNLDAVKVELNAVRAACENDIRQMEKLQNDGERRKALHRLRELQARKWAKQQKGAVQAEIERCIAIDFLDSARRLTDTSALTRKKNQLSEQLLAAEHEARFINELTSLGGSHIRIRVRHERAEKAIRPGFALALQEAKRDVPVPDVLSDGESRVVALATFLADVTAGPPDVPFIFDDPITSLDYDFELATALRLVQESNKRQVIVFTHRLSFLAALSDSADREKVKYRCQALRTDASARGTPVDTFVTDTNPKSALNRLKGERLTAAKDAHATKNYELSDALLKSLCMDVRILAERLVEKVLLSDVISRFRRELITKNKLERLVLINKDDCVLLDRIMTEYSFPLHSQPTETPLKLPTFQKVAEDLSALIAWYDNFKKRA